MADYIPLYDAGDTITLQASATIVGGQLLMMTGDGTVGPATALTTAWIGVAAFDAASGAKVTVYRDAVHKLTASGAITAGDQVAAAAAGAVATLPAAAAAAAADVNKARAVVGVAINTAIDTGTVFVAMS
jgi:hypothetical protein